MFGNEHSGNDGKSLNSYQQYMMDENGIDPNSLSFMGSGKFIREQR
jgi:hypothetical protein